MCRWFGEKIFQCVLVLVLVVRECCGHVVLTYPPPRKYPLDFLNNMATPAPCGMPKDPSVVYYTDLRAGSHLLVFWDIPYPHRGGMFLELLDQKNEVLQRYPQVGEALAEDVSQLNYTIQLPQEPCANCTLRIVKRGFEYGENLLFWSCSDVNLVTTPMTNRQQCSNHGNHDGERCLCDRIYDGEICQFQTTTKLVYEEHISDGVITTTLNNTGAALQPNTTGVLYKANDCIDETDCNNHGQCVDTESPKYPRQQCYCSPGWFGRFCERESPVKTRSDINLLQYTQQTLADNYTLYYRILPDSQELEVVLIAKSVTWIAVGWRPKDVNTTCHGFPVLNFENEKNVSTDEATTTESSLPTKAPELAPDGCDGSCDPASGCLYNVTWVQDPISQIVNFTITVPLQGDEYFGLGFSADNQMPDSDIVVGWVRPDGRTFLSDRWASARERPLEDTQNDLTVVSGLVDNGVTTVTFSRPVDTKDPKDLALDGTECIYLLTAKGKKSNDDTFVYHSEKQPSSRKFCFTNCHGGIVTHAVTEPTRTDSSTTSREPGGGESIPDGRSDLMPNSCDGSCTLPSDCLYNVSWIYDPVTVRVNFSVAVQLDRTQYFGLGFSEDQSMPESDIVVSWVRPDGTTFLSDRWATTRARPVEDTHNNLMLISGQIVNGVTLVMFSRAVDTLDTEDLPLNVTGCIYLLMAKGTKSDDDTFEYHSEKRPSSNKYCFTNCHGVVTPETVTEPTRTDRPTTNREPGGEGNTDGGSETVTEPTRTDRPTTSREPGGEGNTDGGSEPVTETTRTNRPTTSQEPGREGSPDGMSEPVTEPTRTDIPTTSQEPGREGGSEAAPKSCDGSCTAPSDCLYDVSWAFDPATQSVNFSVAVQLASTEYFGLGFSEDQFMPDSDIVVGWVRSGGSTYLSDRWATARVPPEKDTKNDLTVISGQVLNGVTMVTFSRHLDTLDAMDQALNVPGCIYLLTSVGPKSDDDDFSQHSRKKASPSKYCFSNCPSSTAGKPREEPVRRKRAVDGETTRAPKSNIEDLQPMDCTDVIIGSARGNLSRVGDYYTRDRSTPLLDEVYGGSDGLTAALGYEEDGFTTILFRRKLESTEMTDWSIVNDLVHVIWARGQQEGDIYHNPESAYERDEMSERNFYKHDVLKYHGTSTSHRGVRSFNFHEPPTSRATSSPGTTSPEEPTISQTTPSSDKTASEEPADSGRTSTPASGTTSAPAGAPTPGSCSSGGCTDVRVCLFNLSWIYNATEDSVTFQINATVSQQQWVALGVMSEREMTGIDVIAMYFAQDESGEYTIPVASDRNTADRLPGEPDAVSDVQLLAGHRENGVSAFTFRRQSVTGDRNDTDLHSHDASCPFLVYEIGGTVDSQGVLSPPDHETRSRQERVCFGVCIPPMVTETPVVGTQTTSSPRAVDVISTAGVPDTQLTTTSTPVLSPIPASTTSPSVASEATLVMMVIPSSIRLVSLNYSLELSDLHSEVAQQTKASLENELNRKLTDRVMRFQNVVITRFSPGSVVVDFDVRVQSRDTDKVDVRQEVETAMRSVVDTGTLGGHTLDKNYLQISESRIEQMPGNESESHGLGDVEIIIIVVVIVVCLVVVGVVVYKIWTRRKAKSNEMHQTRNGNSQAGINGGQSYAELQTSKDSTRWGSNEEAHDPQSYDNGGYESSHPRYQTYVA